MARPIEIRKLLILHAHNFRKLVSEEKKQKGKANKALAKFEVEQTDKVAEPQREPPPNALSSERNFQKNMPSERSAQREEIRMKHFIRTMGVQKDEGTGKALGECYRNVWGKIVLDASSQKWNRHEMRCLIVLGYDEYQRENVWISTSFETPEKEDPGLRDPQHGNYVRMLYAAYADGRQQWETEETKSL